MYVTVKPIRESTGFNKESNITDELIKRYVGDADSVIDSAIGERYSLPLSETPDIIKTISKYLTAGLLYANEYGEETSDTDKGWEKRLNWATDQLEKIKTGILKLYGADGTELTRATLHQPAFYPTNTSSDEETADNTAPKFTMNKQF